MFLIMILGITGEKIRLGPNYLCFYLHVSKGFRSRPLLQRSSDAAHLSRPLQVQWVPCVSFISRWRQRSIHSEPEGELARRKYWLYKTHREVVEKVHFFLLHVPLIVSLSLPERASDHVGFKTVLS